MLRNQWVKEIKQLFNIEPDTIGGGNTALGDSVITVATIQTLTKLANNFTGSFGTVVVDEAHHTPSTTFTSTLDLLKARYRIALSGTMERKDNKHVLFKDFFGTKVFKPAQNNTINPSVKILKTGIHLAQGVAYASKITILLEDPEYIALVVRIAKVQADKGHKVLLIADRVSFLTRVAELLGDRCILMVGSTANEDERDRMSEQLESGHLDIVAGSRQIFSEGISVNILSCVILCSPIASLPLLEQVIGRVMRLHPKKPEPEVIDMNFSGPSERKANNLRLGFYIQKGWGVGAL